MTVRRRQGDARAPAPLVLIVQDQEWQARALDSVLGPAGYAVLRAYTARQALERAFTARPDAILIDYQLPDRSGLELCSELRQDPRIGPATPLIITSSDFGTRQRRLASLRAGAWDFMAQPPDADELLARLELWIEAKREVARARTEGLLDPATGVYNARGLLQRAAELASEASRYEKPMACIVFAFDSKHADDVDSEPEPALVDAIRDALRGTVRTSDALGRLAPGQFAVLAPTTDAHGAHRLAERVLSALDTQRGQLSAAEAPDIEIGYFGVENVRTARLDPPEMLARASIALRAPFSSPSRDPRIRGYAADPDALN